MGGVLTGAGRHVLHVVHFKFVQKLFDHDTDTDSLIDSMKVNHKYSFNMFYFNITIVIKILESRFKH